MKKISLGSWIAACAAILMVVSFVIYSMNIGGAGYFQKAAVAAMPMTWLAVACLAGGIALSLVPVEGFAAKIVSIVSGLLQIAAPVIIAYCLINLIGARIEGLGFIYFSNADVAKEVQTAENLSSATGAITSMVAYGVSMVAAAVAAFFDLKKD